MEKQSKSTVILYMCMLTWISLWAPMIQTADVNKNPVAGGASPVVSAGAPAISAAPAAVPKLPTGPLFQADVNHPLKISNTTTDSVVIRYKSMKDGFEVDVSASVNPNQSIDIVKKPGTDVIYTSKDCTNCLLMGDSGGAAMIQARR